MISETPPQIFGESDIEYITLKGCEHVAPRLFRDETLAITTKVFPTVRRGFETLNFHSSISADMDGLWRALAIS